MYSVFLEDLEFYGHHGESAEERAVGHRFVLSVEVTVDAPLPESDQVEDTVDYGRLADLLVHRGTGASCRTVEKLSAEMGRAILDRFPNVSQVELSLAKILPPFAHTAHAAGVRCTFARGAK